MVATSLRAELISWLTKVFDSDDAPIMRATTISAVRTLMTAVRTIPRTALRTFLNIKTLGGIVAGRTFGVIVRHDLDPSILVAVNYLQFLCVALGSASLTRIYSQQF